MLHPPDNVKQICFFTEKLEFAVAIFPCSDWEIMQLSYLNSKLHTTETLAKWCITHKIAYQVIYLFHPKYIIKNPRKLIKYIKLQHSIKKIKNI